MWIGGIKVPKLINWLQRKFYDSSPDFVANTYESLVEALAKKPVRYKEAFTAFKIADTVVRLSSVKSEHYRLRAKRARATEYEAFYPMPLKPLCSAELRINNNIPNLTT